MVAHTRPQESDFPRATQSCTYHHGVLPRWQPVVLRPNARPRPARRPRGVLPMPGTSRAGGPGACASSPAAAAASPAKSRCDAGCAVPGRQARGMPRRPPHAPDCAASVRTLRGTTFSRGLRSTRWPRTGVPRVPQHDGRRAPMKQGFARVVVKWHLLPRGSWPPSTPWRQRPRRAARNLPKSRRSRPRTTTWRPRIGRWK